MPAREALRRAGLKPVVLGPKEGLALLNGTQVSTALALAGLFAAERAMAAAFVAGALSVDACLGSDTPFDARIHALRGHRGQIDAAAIYRESSRGQRDPRFAQGLPARAGSVQPALPAAGDGRLSRPDASCRSVLLTEANAVSDNPLVFADAARSFPAATSTREPVAFAADNLALAIAEIGALSERRTALMMDTNLSGLPPFLVEDGGVNSGFMIAQVTAAALASENKSLAHPRRGRFAADLGEPGGPRQHGDVRGAAPVADGGQYRRGSLRSSCSPRPRAWICGCPLKTSAKLARP